MSMLQTNAAILIITLVVLVMGVFLVYRNTPKSPIVVEYKDILEDIRLGALRVDSPKQASPSMSYHSEAIK